MGEALPLVLEGVLAPGGAEIQRPCFQLWGCRGPAQTGGSGSGGLEESPYVGSWACLGNSGD